MLPDNLPEEEEYDRPIHDGTNFPRNDGNSRHTETNYTNKDRFTGLSIDNFDSCIKEEEIKSFLEKNIGISVCDKELSFHHTERKTTVTINSALRNTDILEAVKKLNFADCKKKFLGRPLYCRALRNITPEKLSEYTPVKDNNSQKSPAVSLDMTTNALESPTPTGSGSQKKLEKKERQRQKKLLGQSSPLNAFDRLMKKKVAEQDQENASTPSQKRGPIELSSPNSPEVNEPKKSKNGDTPSGKKINKLK